MNRRPKAYESSALPLSYSARFFKGLSPVGGEWVSRHRGNVQWVFRKIFDDRFFVHPYFASARPVGESAADTLAWLRATNDAPRTGLSRAEEQDLLDDWHTIRA